MGRNLELVPQSGRFYNCHRQAANGLRPVIARSNRTALRRKKAAFATLGKRCDTSQSLRTILDALRRLVVVIGQNGRCYYVLLQLANGHDAP